jgi:hypothetical protein
MDQSSKVSKKDTGLLARYDNKLATSSLRPLSEVEAEKARTDYLGTHQALKQLFENQQQKSVRDLVDDCADTLKKMTGATYVWIGTLKENLEQLTLLGGQTEEGFAITGKFLLMKDSPLEELGKKDLICYPRNALVTFANNPYMQKYNINGLAAHTIRDERRKFLGIICVMDVTTIAHPDYTCELLREAAEGLGNLLKA